MSSNLLAFSKSSISQLISGAFHILFRASFQMKSFSLSPGRKSGGGAAAFGAAGEEEWCRDGGGGILGERAADRAGERAATPAAAGRAAEPRPRLRGPAFRVRSAHTGERGIGKHHGNVLYFSFCTISLWLLKISSIKSRIKQFVKMIFTPAVCIYFLWCCAEHAIRPGAGAAAAGGRAQPEGQREEVEASRTFGTTCKLNTQTAVEPLTVRPAESTIKPKLHRIC